MYKRFGYLFFLFTLFFFHCIGQDSTAVSWASHSEKSPPAITALFNVQVKPGWQRIPPIRTGHFWLWNWFCGSSFCKIRLLRKANLKNVLLSLIMLPTAAVRKSEIFDPVADKRVVGVFLDP
jgi:hypothetical protein